MSNFYDIKIKEYSSLDEKVITAKHSSGLRLVFIPKRGFMKKYASCTFDYGAADLKFKTASGVIHESPLGTAHFLEHKMFDRPDRNILAEFSANGADSNAGTNYSYTTYYFHCTEGFTGNFRLLLDLVKNPVFTEESVQKEKGIIAQEINMYNDDPSYVSSLRAMEAMYKVNPVRYDIAGTAESIDGVTAEELKLVHGSFYAPSNMVITVCGDIEIESVYSVIDEYFGDTEKTDVPVSEVETEDNTEINEYGIITNNGDVPLPIFFLSFKDANREANRNKLHITGEIICETLFGTSSDFYDRNYSEGLINRDTARFFDVAKYFKYSALCGESENPELLAERVNNEIERIKKEGLPKKTLADITLSEKGASLREFNIPVQIGMTASTLALQNTNPFEVFSLYDEITYDYASEVFGNMFKNKPVLSVIRKLSR